jgi:hypothetical protein
VNGAPVISRLCAVGLLTRRVSSFLLPVAIFAALAALPATGCKPEAGSPPPPKEAAPTSSTSPQSLPTAVIRVGPIDLTAEIANTEVAREVGMMFRPKLGPDEAMLFVYPAERELEFWMKDTLVDLDLAYIAADGRILQIAHMVSRNLEPVHSYEPAQFVLEVPSGWFARHNIAEGAKVVIPREVVASADEE